MSTTLNRKQLFAFGLPAMVSAIMHGGQSSILPGIYATSFGLDLSAIGTVLLLSRLFDTVTDPLMGYLSDHTHTRFGKRKPWVVLGYLIALPSLLLLYVPVSAPTALYFFVCLSMVYLGWTIAEIPLVAWSIELSRDGMQRSRIAAYRNFFGAAGSAAFALIPLLPLFATSAFTPETLKFAAWACILLMPPFVIWMLRQVPEGELVSRKETFSLVKTLRNIWRNKPFRFLVVLNVAAGIVGAMQTVGYFLWIDRYLLIGDKLPYILGGSLIVSVAVTPICMPLVARIGYLPSLIWGGLIGGIVVIAGFWVKPGNAAFALLIPILLVNYFNNTVVAIATPALYGDVVDYDCLKTGEDKSGQYMSFFVLLSKATFAVAGSAVYFILDAFGVDVKSNTHSELEGFGLRFVVTLLPGTIGIITSLAYFAFPLKGRRVKIVRRRLEKRAERLKRAQEVAAAAAEAAGSLTGPAQT